MKRVIQRLAGSLPASDGIVTLGRQYTATREAIISQISEGGLHAKKRIAGIECPDELLTKKMLGFFEKENLEILQLKEQLDRAGLPYRAIVRTDFYNRVKRKKGVYTFKNIDEQGAVSISEKSTTEFVHNEVALFEKKAKKAITWVQVIACIAGVFLCEWWLYHLLSLHPKADFGGAEFIAHVFAFCVVFGGVGLAYCEAFDTLLRYVVFTSSAVCKKVEKKLSKESLRIFWPQFMDFAAGPKVKITFIPPPKTIAPQIVQWRKAGYDVHISAQKEAFSLDTRLIKNFMQDTVDSLLRNMARERELILQAKIEAQKAFWRRFDPIISVQEGRYTILIDAYGGKSFVSESEVTASVLDEYNSKLKQFQTILN